MMLNSNKVYLIACFKIDNLYCTKIFRFKLGRWSIDPCWCLFQN